MQIINIKFGKNLAFKFRFSGPASCSLNPAIRVTRKAASHTTTPQTYLTQAARDFSPRWAAERSSEAEALQH